MASLRRHLSPAHRRPARLALAAFACLVGVLWASTAAASIAVSPMRIQATPSPGGGEQVFWLTVSNTCHETTRVVRFSISDFWIAEDGALQVGDEIAPATLARYGGARFVTARTTSVELDVGENRRVPFSVRLPSAATGTYGALITADGGPVAPSVQFGAPFAVRVTFQVSVFVLITAHSDYSGSLSAPSTPERRALNITDVYTELPDSRATDPMVRIYAHITNAGTTHVRGRVTAAIMRVGEGRVIEHITLEGGTRLLLPGSHRRFYGSVRAPLPPALYRVTTQVVADDGSVRATGSGQFQLLEPVAGASEAPARWALLSLDRPSIMLTANSRRADRRNVEVRNHLREPVTVEVQTPHGGDWLTVTPRRFRLPALGVRSVRVAADSDARIPLGKHTRHVVFTPHPRGSDAPLAREAIRLSVVVISPATND